MFLYFYCMAFQHKQNSYRKTNNTVNRKKMVLSVVTLLLVLSVWWMLSGSTIDLKGLYEIKQWDTIQSITRHLSWSDRIVFKRYSFQNGLDFKNLKIWTYQFTWQYKVADFASLINTWPQQSYIRIKILEWWSIYDIQQYLYDQGYIDNDWYLRQTTSPSAVASWKQQFAYLHTLTDAKLQTLEGFLYPDTYFIDPDKDIVDQLIRLQLEAYQKKIVNKYQFEKTKHQIKSDYNITLSSYQLLILASIIEKEEKNQTNKPTIAGLFYNRLGQQMRIDADISLCYGLHQPYAQCTPSVIVQHLQDGSNPYNTRAVVWLPPTPISNPSSSTIDATLNYIKTDYIYYLHDMQGHIYFAQTQSQHESNKAQYLK